MSAKSKAGEKLVTRAYGDLVSPAARAVGDALGQAVRAALSPANLVTFTVEEALEYAEGQVHERFERWRVPPERVVQPSPAIADSVVRLLRFAGQDDLLKEMFLNLLARSMDSAEQAGAHPAFADVLRQLTPLEARAVSTLAQRHPGFALLEVRLQLAGGSFQTKLKHINSLGSALTPPCWITRQAIDNLTRQGVLAIHTDQRITDEAEYERLRQSPAAKEAASSIQAGGGLVAYHEYLAEVTEFGIHFVRAVVTPQ